MLTAIADGDEASFCRLFDIYKQRVYAYAMHFMHSESTSEEIVQDIFLKIWQLLHDFKKITGSGMLINTSFNVRGEPIVCTPEQAYQTFMSTDIDFLVMENFVLNKREPQFTI